LRELTTDSSCFFSRPSSWARLASFQTPGSSSARATSISRACFASKSKIPPQLERPAAQVVERVFDGVEAFGFHEGGLFLAGCELYRRESPY